MSDICKVRRTKYNDSVTYLKNYVRIRIEKSLSRAKHAEIYSQNNSLAIFFNAKNEQACTK